MRSVGVIPPGHDGVSSVSPGEPIYRADQLDEQGFLALQQRYQPSGGLATCEQVSALIRAHDTQPVSTLAHWIVAGDVIQFAWRSQMMLPLFQFERPDITPLPEIASAIGEWHGALDALGLALWFSRRNRLLGDEAPADAMRLDPEGVVLAARADRFALLG